MIYIPQKLILIHIPRSGGTSVGRALLPFLFRIRISELKTRIARLLSNFIPLKNGIEVMGYNRRFEKKSAENFNKNKIWKHSKAIELKEHLGEEKWSQCYKLAVSKRNVYDRIASYYFHKKKINMRDPQKYPEVRNVDFKEYILEGYYDKTDNILEYISDEKGNIIVDCVLNFEHLSKESTQIFQNLFYCKISVHHHNKSNRKINYRQLYDNEMIAKITRDYNEEINRFNWRI